MYFLNLIIYFWKVFIIIATLRDIVFSFDLFNQFLHVCLFLISFH
jgi:hypothetical protein